MLGEDVNVEPEERARLAVYDMKAMAEAYYNQWSRLTSRVVDAIRDAEAAQRERDAVLVENHYTPAGRYTFDGVKHKLEVIAYAIRRAGEG